MKNKIIKIILIAGITPLSIPTLKSQETIFGDDFDVKMLFEWENRHPSCDYCYGWVNFTTDDNPNLKPHSGKGFMRSASWATNGIHDIPLTPDNWLISPAIEASGSLSLQYYVAAGDPLYPNEHYAVYVSTTGTSPSDFTLLWQETLGAPVVASVSEGTQWEARNIDMGTFHGMVHIAFRHFNCNNQFALHLDDIAIFEVYEKPVACYPVYEASVIATQLSSNSVKLTWESPDNRVTGYRIERNSQIVGTNIHNPEFVDNGLTPGVYNYGIYALYGNDICEVSYPAYIQVEIEGDCDPVSNVVVSNPQYDDLLITWEPPVAADNLAGYNIYRNSTLVETVSASTHSYIYNFRYGQCDFYIEAVFNKSNCTTADKISSQSVLFYPEIYNLRYGMIEGGHVLLRWDRKPDPNMYQRYDIFRNGSCIYRMPISNTEFFDGELLDPGIYEYTIRPIVNYEYIFSSGNILYLLIPQVGKINVVIE